MPGSSDAIQTVPSPVSSGGLEAAAELIADRQARRSANAISKVAWVPREELVHSEWLATGRRLGAIGRCSQWWIGDWIRYGASRWGEKYAEAARVTGYDVASLRNMAWVASRFDLSLRSDKLSWSHHVLLAPLEPGEQVHWLERAVQERLSVADLRLEMRRAQEGDRRPVATEAEDGDGRAEGVIVCPECGHELRASTD
jgi:hypothetical protein